MATPKQQKLINLILANLGNQKSTKSMKELMREAGYSESQSKNPYQILESEVIKDGLADFVKQLDDKRRRAITYLTDDKLEKSSGKDLVTIINGLTKDHQLLTGEETERQGVSINVIDSFDGNNNTVQVPT